MTVSVVKLSSFKKARFFLGLLLLSTAGSAAAVAQDTSSRLNRLENDVSTLERAVYRGEAPAVPISGISGAGATPAGLQVQADNQLKIQQLEVEVRRLNGRLEEQSHEMRMLRRAFETSNEDIALRLQDLEGGATAANNTASTAPQSLTANGRAITGSSAPAAGSLGTLSSNATPDFTDATLAYENAFSLLKQGKYVPAQKGFEGFLKVHPTHPLAGNAKYWLGETFYVRGQYEDAARVFAEGFSSYPKGAKAPDNLLKLGIALGALKKTDDACLALQQIAKEFPTGAASVTRRAERELVKLDCK